MKDYKVRIDLVRFDNSDELVESFIVEVKEGQSFGEVLCQAFKEHDIDEELLTHYSLNLYYVS